MSMLSILRVSVLISALLSVQLVFAQTNSEDGPDKIRQVLKQQFPDLTIDEVSPSPVKGLYQVAAGSTVIYITGDGHYAFNGDIIDLAHSQSNLTEDFRKQARLKGLKSLGQENMIIFSPKNPKYTVSVFTDVDCGYCRKMQSEMAKINSLGIAIRYLAFPRSGPNTPTFEKMVSIWCSKDKNRAISLAQQDKPIETTMCPNNNVMKEFQFGISIGVAGTPTLIFEDGTLVPGYLPPDKLLEVAEQLSKKKTS